MPTNRTIAYSTQVSHISSGASLTAGSFSASTDVAAALTSTNMARYPLAEVTLVASTGGTANVISSASNTVLLYRRDMNINGAGDAEAPSSNHSQILVGAFVCPTGASALCVPCGNDVPLVDECEFYIENRTDESFISGWKLLVKPKTDSFS
jgi:hypothetical protein